MGLGSQNTCPQCIDNYVHGLQGHKNLRKEWRNWVAVVTLLQLHAEDSWLFSITQATLQALCLFIKIREGDKIQQ